MKRFLGLGIADLVLLVLAFGLVHLIHYGHLEVSEANERVLALHFLLWLLVSLAARKFSRLPELSLLMGAKLLLILAAVHLFLISFIIVGLQLMHFSRTMAYGTVALLLLMQVVSLILFQWLKGPNPHPARLEIKGPPSSTSPFLLILDGALLIAAFFTVTYIKRDSLELTYPYGDILLLLMGLWIVCSLITHKFNRNNFSDFLNAFAPALKAAGFMLLGLAFLIYFLRLEPVSRFQVFGAIPLLLALEGVLFKIYSGYHRYKKTVNKDVENSTAIKSRLDSAGDRINLEQVKPASVQESVKPKLKDALDFFDPRIFEFVKNNAALSSIDRQNSALLSTDNLFNLEILKERDLDLFINLHKINDIRRLNYYFLLLHEKLRPGGYLTGKAHTYATHRDYFYSTYPWPLNALYFWMSFVWGRIFPKLPGLKKFYFGVTKGKGRMISRAEILGRLCFCGYKIVAEENIGHRFFFIAQKAYTPSNNPNPTYGPLVRLKRSGLGGTPITVYKFRTMHPFSEHLQEYVFDHCNLEKGGKFKDDFRVTGWGSFMRRTWLDELPMLYNWIRGDLRLVGVRPLSSQYLQLYSDEMRTLRHKVKPGLLPPFYADLPKTLEEIMDSERRYIESYLEKPCRTQIRYFLLCVYNIVIKRARSG